MCDSRSVYNACLRLYAVSEQQHRGGAVAREPPKPKNPKVKSARANFANPAAAAVYKPRVEEDDECKYEQSQRTAAPAIEFHDFVPSGAFKQQRTPEVVPAAQTQAKPAVAASTERKFVMKPKQHIPEAHEVEQHQTPALQPPVSPVSVGETSRRPTMPNGLRAGKGVPRRKLQRPALAIEDDQDIGNIWNLPRRFRDEHERRGLEELLVAFAEHDEQMVIRVWEACDGNFDQCLEVLTSIVAPPQPQPQRPAPKFEGTRNAMAWPALSVRAMLRASTDQAASEQYKEALLRTRMEQGGSDDDEYVMVESNQTSPAEHTQQANHGKRRRKAEVDRHEGDAFAEDYFTFKSDVAVARSRKHDLCFKSKRERARYLARLTKREAQKEHQQLNSP